MRHLLAVAALCAALGWRSAPAATEVQLTPAQAQEFAAALIVEGKLPQARRFLEDLHRAAPGDPQTRFLLAEVAVREGRDQDAVRWYRGLLAEDRTRLRVRLELARTLLRLGQHEAARYHFELALGEDLPPTARESVLAYLRRIQSQSSRLSVSLLLTPDSNPNRGSTEETVRVLGRTFALNNDARAQGGAGLTGYADGRLAFGEENRAYLRGYAEHRDYGGDYADYTYGQASLGRHWQIGKHVLSAEAGPAGAWYRGSLLHTGATAQVTHTSPLAASVLASQYVQVKRFDYVTGFDNLDSHQVWAGGTVQWALGGRTLLTASAAAGRNAASEHPYSYRALTASVAVTREFAAHVNVQVRWLAQRYAYDEALVLFGDARQDDYREVALDLIPRGLSVHGFAPKLTVGHARNGSNIGLYAYTRTYLGIGVTRDF